MEKLSGDHQQIRFKIVMLLTSYVLILSAQTVVFDSSSIPIVVIDTHGQTIISASKITADMGIIYNGPGEWNHVSDAWNDYNGKIGIEIRGSSSQMFPKKQYAVETRDSLGNDLNASLLGMPLESDWILYAVYNDKTLLRDVLAFKLSNDLGMYGTGITAEFIFYWKKLKGIKTGWISPPWIWMMSVAIH